MEEGFGTSKYLVLWHVNPVAPWPSDPAEHLKVHERAWAAIDGLLKKGELREFGWFLDGRSGYVFGEGTPADALRDTAGFAPFWTFEVHEVLSYEEGKEVIRGVTRAMAQARG